LIELDQLLNSVIEQYQQVKNGNFVKVSLPEGSSDNNNQTQKSQGKGVSTPKQTQPSLLDLLDFDGSSNGSPSSTTAKTTGKLDKRAFDYPRCARTQERDRMAIRINKDTMAL